MKTEMRHLNDEYLFLLAQGELNADERARAEAHASTCAECREALDEWAVLHAELASAPLPPVPLSVDVKLAERLSAAQEPGRRSTVLRWAFTAAAAVILLCAGYVLGLHGRQDATVIVSAPPPTEIASEAGVGRAAEAQLPGDGAMVARVDASEQAGSAVAGTNQAMIAGARVPLPAAAAVVARAPRRSGSGTEVNVLVPRTEKDTAETGGLAATVAGMGAAVAVVRAVEGNPVIVRDGKEVPASANAPLYGGDEVTSGEADRAMVCGWRTMGRWSWVSTRVSVLGRRRRRIAPLMRQRWS